MKKKFFIFNTKLIYFFKHLLSSENPDRKSTLEKNKIVVENNLRWQDDGGPVVEVVEPVKSPVDKE